MQSNRGDITARTIEGETQREMTNDIEEGVASSRENHYKMAMPIRKKMPSGIYAKKFPSMTKKNTSNGILLPKHAENFLTNKFLSQNFVASPEKHRSHGTSLLDDIEEEKQPNEFHSEIYAKNT
jgi:hypothetical protein